MSGYYFSPIDSIMDSMELDAKNAKTREANRIIREVEFNHFKNVVKSRLGSDPVIAKVISQWRPGKAPINCKMQILGAKQWSVQQKTDIEAMYTSFKHLNDIIWEAERKYGKNPKVTELIRIFRQSDDIRQVAFERRLQKILNKEVR